jgi:hypothetical protein
MHIYRLEPTESGSPTWQNSSEKDCVWVAAQTPQEARAIVAAHTRLHGREGSSVSPWEDEAVTACVLEPTMSHIGAGKVVRADGSLVN